jgi:NAD(P)-dependent dehydrogenase (short-subunit alcohol dehydrogenase family)
MAGDRKTVIVTGASQGIGAGVVQAFLAGDYNVIGTARRVTKSKELSASDHLALIDGDIGQFETAQKVAQLAIKKFGSIDAVVERRYFLSEAVHRLHARRLSRSSFD